MGCLCEWCEEHQEWQSEIVECGRCRGTGRVELIFDRGTGRPASDSYQERTARMRRLADHTLMLAKMDCRGRHGWHEDCSCFTCEARRVVDRSNE